VFKLSHDLIGIWLALLLCLVRAYILLPQPVLG